MPQLEPKKALILLTALVVCVLGWDLFYFLTDDAYIVFRYIDQRMAGNGYVWNAAPFLPVEGYTCFGWMVLLDGVWSLFGVAPPDSANVLSLLFSLGTVLLTAHWANRLMADGDKKGQLVGLAVALGFLVTNRLFLTWTSSGLETALFNFLLLGWVYAAFRMAQAETVSTTGWWVMGLAAAMGLVRPDGYLFCAASVAIVGAAALRGQLSWKAGALRCLPLLAVVTHVLWRKSFYGEWLPNTYYAKVVGPLPDIGAAYFLAFVVEHGIWAWAIAVCVGVWKSGLFKKLRQDWAPALAMAALVAHLLYYVVVAGGDHFEYRILSHWAPLLALSLVWASLYWELEWSMRGAVFGLIWLVMSTLPWMHFGVSQEHTQWSRALPDYSIADEVPGVLQGPAESFDALQQWLVAHGVAMRHQQHKVFSEHQRAQLPSREQTRSKFAQEENPVIVVTSAGIAAWRFPSVHVVDVFGLSDYVVARTPPVSAEAARVVAHARQPPQGYIEAFRPNLWVTPSKIGGFQLRKTPLTDEEIRAIETRFRDALPEDRNTPVGQGN